MNEQDSRATTVLCNLSKANTALEWQIGEFLREIEGRSLPISFTLFDSY